MSDVTDRLAALEAQLAGFTLPPTVAVLQRKLEADWQPDAGVLLQAGSVSLEMLADSPHVCLARAANQATTSGVHADVSWDAAIDANAAMWASGTTATLSRAGKWQINAEVAFAAAASGARRAAILVGGGEVRANEEPGSASAATTLPLSLCRYFASGSAVKLDVFQSSGGALNVTAFIDITWIGN